jgi:hypothetical protein
MLNPELPPYLTVTLSKQRFSSCTSVLGAGYWRGKANCSSPGCGDQCPYVPGLRCNDWPLSDPKGRPMEEVRNVRDEIRTRVYDLLKAEGLSLAESLHGRVGPPPDHLGANKTLEHSAPGS